MPNAGIITNFICVCIFGFTSIIVAGICAWFMNVRDHLGQDKPWVIPFMIAIGIITFIYAPLTAVLPSRSDPDNAPRTSVLQGLGVIFIILWVTGAIATGIQLFGGSSENLNSYCTSKVFTHNMYGPSGETQAWLFETNYCNCWRAVFAFEIIAITALVLFTVIIFCQDVYDVHVHKYRQEAMEDHKRHSGRDIPPVF